MYYQLSAVVNPKYAYGYARRERERKREREGEGERGRERERETERERHVHTLGAEQSAVTFGTGVVRVVGAGFVALAGLRGRGRRRSPRRLLLLSSRRHGQTAFLKFRI